MFSIILFLICFCLASIAMYEPAIEHSTTADSFDQFYSAVKEVFAPEPFVIAESTEPLSTAQTNISAAWVTPEEQELINPTPQFTIRQLVRFVD
jgi:hypothetical protein